MKPIAKGYVTDIARKYFWCQLRIGDEDVVAKVAISKLSSRERPLLAEGAYLVLLKGGTWRFLRLKPWTRKEIEAARTRAKKMYRDLFTNHEDVTKRAPVRGPSGRPPPGA